MQSKLRKGTENPDVIIPAKPVQSLFDQLSPESKKQVLSPKPVFLYHSKWGDSPLSAGKVHLNDSIQETLQWSSVRELQKTSISLSVLKSAELLTRQSAVDFMKTYASLRPQISEKRILVISYFEDLILEFQDEEACSEWVKVLTYLSKFSCGQENEERKESLFPDFGDGYYGAVLDITEPDPPDESWRNIKITFIKLDDSKIEYMVYDRSQEDLYDSVNEILRSVEKFVDCVSYNIIKAYLFDVTRIEYSERIMSLPSFREIQGLTASSLKYKRKENTELRSQYKDINGIELGKQIIKSMRTYEGQDYGDNVADCLNLLLVQKLTISLNIHQLACEYALISKRKSYESAFEKPLKKEPIRKSDNSSEVEMRINQIISKEPTSPKSNFRDACECLIV